MSAINFSIIIPHKNTPTLLQRCIDSIPNRKDIQIIVVDDNSDAASIQKLKRIIQAYNYIEVYFSEKSLGAGHARNIGLQHALGKWLLFADSDDFYNPCFEKRIDHYLYSRFDLIIFSASSVNSTTFTPAKRNEMIKEYHDIYKQDPQRGEILLKYYFTENWAKMYKAELIMKNDITFDETYNTNDYMFSVKAAYYARFIHEDDSEIYCITVRENSLTGQYDTSLNDIMIRYGVSLRVCLFFKEHHIPVTEKYLVHLLFKIRDYSWIEFFKQLLKLVYYRLPFRYYSRILKVFVSKVLISLGYTRHLRTSKA